MNTGTIMSHLLKNKTQKIIFIILCGIVGTYPHYLSAFNWRIPSHALLTKVAQYPVQAFKAMKSVNLKGPVRAAWATMTKENIIATTKKTLKIGAILGAAYLMCRAIIGHKTSRVISNTYRVEPQNSKPYKLTVTTDAKVIIHGHHKNTIVVNHHYGTSWLNDLPNITFDDSGDENMRQVTVNGHMNTCHPSFWQKWLAKLFFIQPQRKLSHVIYVPYDTDVEVVTSNNHDYTHKRDIAIRVEKVIGESKLTAEYEDVIWSKERPRRPGETKPVKGLITNKRDQLNLRKDVIITAPHAKSVIVDEFARNLRYTGPEAALKYNRHIVNNGYYHVDNKHPFDRERRKNDKDKNHPYMTKLMQKAEPCKSNKAAYIQWITTIQKTKTQDGKDTKFDPTQLQGCVLVNRPANDTKIFDNTPLPADYFETVTDQNGKQKKQLKKDKARELDNQPESFKMSYPIERDVNGKRIPPELLKKISSRVYAKR